MKTNYNFNHMTEDEKILAMVDILGAVSPETAVTMEQMIAKGIEVGATTDYFRENWHGYQEGDHPWWQKVAPMMGVGTREEVAEHNVPHLHRKQSKEMKNGRKTNVMRYWWDETKEHKVVIREKAKPEPVVTTTFKKFTLNEMKRKMEENPGVYVILNGRLYKKDFVLNHPEKFDAASLAIANMQ